MPLDLKGQQMEWILPWSLPQPSIKFHQNRLHNLLSNSAHNQANQLKDTGEHVSCLAGYIPQLLPVHFLTNYISHLSRPLCLPLYQIGHHFTLRWRYFPWKTFFFQLSAIKSGLFWLRMNFLIMTRASDSVFERRLQPSVGVPDWQILAFDSQWYPGRVPHSQSLGCQTTLKLNLHTRSHIRWHPKPVLIEDQHLI